MVRDDVLKTLELNRGKCVSGEVLAKTLGVSRAAVWKAIENLRTQGMNISSIQGGGYLLEENDDNLNEAGIFSILQTKEIGKSLKVLSQIDSTNTEIKKNFAHEKHGFTLIANEQTSGRGRLGRTFCSPSGGIYMSMLLRPEIPVNHLNFITIFTAIAVCRAIEETCGIKPQVKWVNDVLMDNKKISGILTEASIEGETGTVEYVVVGIGLNVNIDEETIPEEVREIAGSLSDFMENPPRRTVLVASILKHFEELYNILNEGNLSYIIEEYRQLLCVIDKKVRVISARNTYNATVKSLNDQGFLIVEDEQGVEHVLSSGEISISKPLACNV